MADKVELWGRYGILRVQPQAQTPAYVHRNGETEPPTVAGRYWFNGHRTKQNGNRVRVMDLVEVNVYCGVYNDTDGETDAFASYVGQWWGPVIPPWDR